MADSRLGGQACGPANRDANGESGDRPVAAAKPTANTMQDCSDPNTCPDIVGLPGGVFVMGSPKSEPGRFDDEEQHHVNVAPFALAKSLVTKAQWAAFVASANMTGEYQPRPARLLGERPLTARALRRRDRRSNRRKTRARRQRHRRRAPAARSATACRRGSASAAQPHGSGGLMDLAGSWILRVNSSPTRSAFSSGPSTASRNPKLRLTRGSTSAGVTLPKYSRLPAPIAALGSTASRGVS